MLDDSELFTDSGWGFQGSVFVTPLLEKISSQSSIADQTRSIDESLIRELKDNDIMRISASAELGGLGESVVSIANELRAIAPRCTSTAWCMWNHLCTFHHFAGLFGPKNKNFLTQIVANQEWVCFPAGGTALWGSYEADSSSFRWQWTSGRYRFRASLPWFPSVSTSYKRSRW